MKQISNRVLRWSGRAPRGLVGEAVDGGDPALLVQFDHIESDHRRLLAAGHASAYSESPLNRSAALVVDRRWTMADADDAVGRLVSGRAAELLEPPVNVPRPSPRSRSPAPRIANLPQRRGTCCRDRTSRSAPRGRRTRRAADRTGRRPRRNRPRPAARAGRSPRVKTEAGVLSPLGTAMDVTVADLATESSFPADEPAAECFRA